MKAHEAITALQAMDPNTEVEEIKKVGGRKYSLVGCIATMTVMTVCIAAIAGISIKILHRQYRFSPECSIEQTKADVQALFKEKRETALRGAIRIAEDDADAHAIAAGIANDPEIKKMHVDAKNDALRDLAEAKKELTTLRGY